jgi:DNA-binding MarR family transcriptional regulator
MTRGRSTGATERALYEALQGLSHLAAAFERRRQQLARTLGLTDAQLRVLEEIARDDFMPSLFARRRACSAAAVSRTLRQLQDAGWVRAAIGEADARQRAYQVTAAGRKLVERLRAERLAALDAIWADLPDTELARFGEFSRRLAERLDAYSERRGRAAPAARGAPRRG